MCTPTSSLVLLSTCINRIVSRMELKLKTEALWIGAKCGSSDVPFPERNFKWPKYKAKTLGIWLSVHPEETTDLNYDEKLVKVRNIVNSWNYRRLTLMGKIAVLKSLSVVSQFIYVLSPLPLNVKAIFAFLWNGKGDKIKRNTIIDDIPNGGLKMIDIVCFSKSLKATWIKKIFGCRKPRKMETVL